MVRGNGGGRKVGSCSLIQEALKKKSCIVIPELFCFANNSNREFEVPSLNFPGHAHRWRLSKMFQKGSDRTRDSLLKVRFTPSKVYSEWFKEEEDYI